jgi:DNA-directed RNA polymerase subunit M/transcription elongation factor TFIIS
MESLDQQWQQLKERYAQMTEDELAALAQQAGDLTDVAQEALQAVIAERGLDIQLKMEPPAQLRGHPPEDEELVILGWAENVEQAGRVMKALTAAGISSFLNVEVLEGDLKRAQAALADALEDEDTEEEKDYAVLCPKCRSAKVVMEERDSSSAAPFHWHCDACGHHWSDDGIGQKVAGGQSWPGEEFPAPSEDWDPK